MLPAPPAERRPLCCMLYNLRPETRQKGTRGVDAETKTLPYPLLMRQTTENFTLVTASKAQTNHVICQARDRRITREHGSNKR